MAIGSNGYPIMPTLDEVERLIERFSLDPVEDDAAKRQLPEAFIKYMEGKLGLLRASFPIVIKPNMTFGGRPFYRIRLSDESIATERLDAFSYPPCVQRYDRCSMPGYPVFYCTDHVETAVRESVFNSKVAYGRAVQHAYLSEWGLRSGESLRVVPFSYQPLDPESDLHGLDRLVLTGLEKQMEDSDYPQDQIEGAKRTLRFLMDAFVSDNMKSVSSYVAHSQLYARAVNRPDVLMYPSIPTAKRRASYAFHPNSVAKLKMNKAYHIILRDMDPFKKHFKHSPVSVVENFDGVLLERMLTYEESVQVGEWFESAFEVKSVVKA